jgi:hypothetical protein
MALVTLGRTGRRTPPVEFADAVELWARGFGKHAKLEWSPALRYWRVLITLNPNDPRNQLEGEAHEAVDLLKPGEVTNPVTGRGYPGLVPQTLDELGVQGLIDLLNETNLERGRYRSAEEAFKDQREKRIANEDRLRRSLRDDAGHAARRTYRQVTGAPFAPVGVDITAAPAKRAHESQEE